jgi:hypothetical protein
MPRSKSGLCDADSSGNAVQHPCRCSAHVIHAANERTGVRIDQIGADYWAKRLEGYRSVL